jgi:succinate dehydrogenase/fumarate reductase flavoprotein subunit
MQERQKTQTAGKKHGNELSRRGFLTGAGLTAAAAATSALIGCADGSAKAKADDAASTSWLPDSWDYETDILVIGYGGAGLWAAVTAKDEGGSEVLVLEKAPLRGGGSSSINMGEYTWVEDPELANTYIQAFTKGMTPNDVSMAWAKECYRNIDYCDKYGIPTEVKKGSNAAGGLASCEYPWLDGANAMRVCSFGDPAEGGNSGWKVLDKVRADMGIEVVFSCHDETLIQNPATKEIVGCYTLIGDDATPKAVKARKGVILTLGGFEHNKELKEKYLKCYPAMGFYSWPFNTGDGIKMVEDVGAQLWHMNQVCGSYCGWFKDFEWNYAFWLTPLANSYVILDQLGKRWWKESDFMSPHTGFHNFVHFVDDPLIDYDRCPSWYVFDQAVIDAGAIGQLKGGIMNTPAGVTKIGMGLDDVPEECGRFAGWSVDNSEEIKKGWIVKGATIEELATNMAKVDRAPKASAIRETLERYNGFCASGDDADLGRDPATMQPINTGGTLYAYPVYPGGNNTMGGPKKNAAGQVVDLNDEPIGRLFAAGSFGNMQAHTYGITGGNNAENMVWGRICARSAAKLEPWDVA